MTDEERFNRMKYACSQALDLLVESLRLLEWSPETARYHKRVSSWAEAWTEDFRENK